MPDDTVSSLWSRLMESELQHVKGNEKLAELLLRRPTEYQHASLYDRLADRTNSTHAAARYYHRVVQYVEGKEVSEGLRRIVYFINDLASGAVEMKNTEKAKQLRETGNRYFRSGHLTKAAAVYREALLHAPHSFPFLTTQESLPTDAIEAALLHGNLSAVFARQQSWTDCLWEALVASELHIQNKQSGMPSALKRLWSRIIQCCDHMGLSYTQLESGSVPDLHHIITIRNAFLHTHSTMNESCPMLPEPRYGFQEAYPGLSSGLKVAKNKQKGRHVIATKEFQPGDVLAVEPASGWSSRKGYTRLDASAECLLLLPSQRMSKCTACMNSISAVGFLCPYCCDAAYCAPPSKCFFKHFTRSADLYGFNQPPWHTAECRFMFLLNSTGLGHLCFRLAWLRRQNPEEVLSEQPTVDQLVSHFEEFEFDDLFEYALTAWLLAKLLNRCLPAQTSEMELTDGLWCFDTLRRLQCNAHAITDIQETLTTDVEDSEVYPSLSRLSQVRVATALFPSVSMLNHACEPSVSNSFEDQYIVLRCIKQIHPSDEVYNCYGPHWLHENSVTTRQEQLQKQYFFKCDCMHCLKPRCTRTPKPTGSVIRQWNEAVSRMMCIVNKESVTLSDLTHSWDNACKIGTLSCPHCEGHWWPEDETPGSLWDMAGRQYIKEASHTEDPEISHQLKLTGVHCLAYSVNWVLQHFGVQSTEYLWELVNFLRITSKLFDKWPSFNPQVQALSVPVSAERVRETIHSLTCLLYGERKTKEIENRLVHQDLLLF